ncbi:MAG: bifunctional adenosylcobinamide kinase/adenosylcobinamide-phosphate guanylyltransferase [Muribaculaceae bacterium]|nr:bifunctional adenosylcobinamide kinase/adenosylcobinamide-phosphate guanylyltransferase [Muribaculaceae bacterium]
MHSPHITLITGGQRSGKSEMAEKLALEMSTNPVYIATSTVPADDSDWQVRVAAHQARRGPQWTTVEESLTPSLHADALAAQTVLLDCLTLWCTNLFFHHGEDSEATLATLKAELEALSSTCAHLIVVTNEIGLGGISPNTLQRRFTDLQGMANRTVAAMADEVYFMISGIPVKIKG